MMNWIKNLSDAMGWRKPEGEQLNADAVRFQRLIKTANLVAEKNPRGLADLVYAILRPLQSEALLGVAERGTDAVPDIDIPLLFGDAVFRKFFADGHLRGRELPREHFRLKLGKHAVLPWPWHHSRYVSALATIGADKINPEDPWGRRHSGAWKQDINHSIPLWLPWGIAEVCGGNHSIMAGILAGEGELKPSAVYDMTCVLEDIRTDGINWFDSASGEMIGTVSDPRFAAVFEIGRIMVREGFPAFSLEAMQARSISHEDVSA